MLWHLAGMEFVGAMVRKTARFALVTAAAVVFPIIVSSGPAEAISWGKRQPDGMVCRVLFGTPHDHKGRGRGATQDEAFAAALKRWSWFVAFEYGKRWSHWSLSRRQKGHCSMERNGWKCKVEAQPCRY